MSRFWCSGQRPTTRVSSWQLIDQIEDNLALRGPQDFAHEFLHLLCSQLVCYDKVLKKDVLYYYAVFLVCIIAAAMAAVNAFR